MSILHFDKAIEVDEIYAKTWDRYCNVLTSNSSAMGLLSAMKIRVKLT
jgi:hypothetical protein